MSDPGSGRRPPSGQVLRAPAVAGVFYPSSPGELRRTVEEALAGAAKRPSQNRPGARPVKAVIAPHAGYVYSGSVAASAYARLAPGRGTVQRVVVIGPAHRVALDAVATSSADAFATPLGKMALDVDGRRAALSCPGVVVDDRAHAAEHSLEVQLPFLQVVLGEVTLLPLLIGQVPATVIADVLEAVWGGPETLVVTSSDLSHYHDHATATALDRETATAIVACRPDDVGLDRACGVFAVRGLLEAARRRHLTVEMVDLCNSGDTAGGGERVVGYGAFVLA